MMSRWILLAIFALVAIVTVTQGKPGIFNRDACPTALPNYSCVGYFKCEGSSEVEDYFCEGTFTQCCKHESVGQILNSLLN